MLPLFVSVAAAEPPLSVRTSLPEAAPELELVVSLGGAPRYTCRFGQGADSCPPTEGWYAGPGNYTVATRVGRKKALSARTTVRLGGGEAGLGVSAAYTVSMDGELALHELLVTRELPAPAGLTLVPAWEPEAEADPRYTLVNGSGVPVWSLEGRVPRDATVERRTAQGWEPSVRGGFCGTVSFLQGPLAPGDESGISEGPFIGRPRPFEPGEYRVVAHVTPAPQPLRGTGVRVVDVWSVSAPFVIWDRANGQGAPAEERVPPPAWAATAPEGPE